MRELFGSWGIQLADDEFAYAVLALGLVPRQWRGKGVEQALAALQKCLAKQTDKPLPWILNDNPANLNSWASAMPAGRLASVVRTTLSGSHRIVVYTQGTFDALQLWRLWSLYSPYGIACSFNFLRQARSSKGVRFQWPVKVGHFRSPEDEAMAEFLRQQDSWQGNVFEVGPLTRRHVRCGILAMAGDAYTSLGSAFESLSRGSAALGGVTADLVVVALWNLPSNLRLEDLEPLREWVGATGLVVVPVDPPAPVGPFLANTLRSILVGLSHAESLDQAVSRATGGRALLVADQRLIDSAHLKRRISALADTLKSAGNRRSSVDVDPESAGRLGLGAETLSRENLGVALTRNVDNLGFLSEGHEASAVGRVFRRIEQEDGRSSRFLNVGILATDTIDATPLSGPLRASTPYFVSVFIGDELAGYMRGGETFPDEKLPNDGRNHFLRVVLWDRWASPEPQVKDIELPPTGNSKPCKFQLYTSTAGKDLAARVTVLHRNRVLQSGLLEAPVGASDGMPTFTLDLELRMKLGGLDERLNFDLAFVLNDVAGQGQIHSMSEAGVATLDMDNEELKALQRVLGTAFTEITDNPENYRGLRAKGTEELLGVLARKGASLREYLVKYGLREGALKAPRYIQVVAAKLLPVEFLYDLESPDADAKVCPNAEAGLSGAAINFDFDAGEDEQCMGCPIGTPGFEPAKIICPLAFWGLRCVIERREPKDKEMRQGGEYKLIFEPVDKDDRVLRPLVSTVVGATEKARTFDDKSVDKMVARIKNVVPNVTLVKSWEDWVNAVNKVPYPTLLTLLLHQEKSKYGPQLDIGSRPYLDTDLIKDYHVHTASQKVTPLALLIGCETTYADISYENAALRFKWRGSALVVSTIAKVLGRDAAPVAAELIEEISRVTEPTSFGIVLRNLRRRLLLEGSPMVLSLTALGDADWDVVGGH